MCTSLPTPAEMAVWDREAGALGLPPVLLMGNAAREALHALETCAAPLRGKRVLLFMGGGNNGGDAAALARQLLDSGAVPLVVHTRPLGAAKGAAARHIRLARVCGVPFAPAARWLHGGISERPDIVVDGLLGTGFSGVLRPAELALVERINALRPWAYIFALDIPSGLHGLTGQPLPTAVRANATVTFEAAKPGLVLPCALPYTGRLLVRPIGIPACVRAAHPASYQLLTAGALAALPDPAYFAHKGKAGQVLIIGGSARYAGAAQLAALAALRGGAGLVTLAAPEAVLDRIRGGCPDLMCLPLPGADWSAEHARPVAELAARCGALALGPGLGRTPGAAALTARLLALPERPPCVVDADALMAVAEARLYASLRPDDILTPHPGEAARLLGSTPAQVQADRLAAHAALRGLAPAVWVLKGAGTLIGRGPEPTLIAPFDRPNLAVGGAGDVLTGCAAALLAQGVPARDAAAAAVLIHAEAGRMLAEHFPARGNTASDIAAALPAAKAALLRTL